MTITLNFTDRSESIQFFKSLGNMPNTVAALEAAEFRDRYQAALKLVAQIDYDLYYPYNQHRRRWPDRIYRRRSTGALLTELDQVVHAILQDDLVIDAGNRPLGDGKGK